MIIEKGKVPRMFRMDTETFAISMDSIESFRERLSPEEAATLWQAILVWAMPSAGDRTFQSKSNFSGRSSSAELLSGLEDALASITVDSRKEASTLSFAISKYQSVPVEVLQRAVENAVQLAERGKLNAFIPPLDFYGSHLVLGNGAMPDEVVSLMVQIAAGYAPAKVFCPYDDYARFAVQVATSMDANVRLESTRVSLIPKLTQILSGSSFDIAFRGHLFEDEAASSELQQYNSAIALIPWGKASKRMPIAPLHADKFTKPTNSLSVHILVHLLNQLRHSVIVGVYNGFLVGRSAEKELTKKIVDKEMLEAVISMPPAILANTEHPFSILVLNPQGGCSTVRFVKGDSKQFYERDGRNRTVLKDWPDLLQVYKNGGDRSIVQDIPTAEIAENNYLLEVSRYVLSKDVQKAYSYTSIPNASHKVKRLGECVETIRPHLKVYKDGNKPARELMTAEFPEFGYLKQPEREVSFSDSALGENQLERLFIQPHDIVLSIKGLTGRVAIAPPETPKPGSDGWLANQSCLILRVNKKKIDSIYLFLYLASEAGQALLQQISTGTSTALIQLQPLRALPIPIPPFQEMQEISQIFHRQVALQEEIAQRRTEQIQLSKKYWSL